MPRPARLPTSFYDRPALEVARALLGKVLVVHPGPEAEGGEGEGGAGPGAVGAPRLGRIVETEAYVGEHDLACHSSRGRTPRTEVMFGPPGRAYVYLIYGMHHCFNAVTGRVGDASAVLVRAVEPLGGLPEAARTQGPGLLCRALGITRAHNGLSLASDALHLLDAPAVPEARVARGPRVGVDYAGTWADEPYRLWVADSPFVSRAGRHVPRAAARSGRAREVGET